MFAHQTISNRVTIQRKEREIKRRVTFKISTHTQKKKSRKKMRYKFMGKMKDGRN